MWHARDQSKESCDEIERHLKHSYSPVVQKKNKQLLTWDLKRCCIQCKWNAEHTSTCEGHLPLHNKETNSLTWILNWNTLQKHILSLTVHFGWFVLAGMRTIFSICKQDPCLGCESLRLKLKICCSSFCFGGCYNNLISEQNGCYQESFTLAPQQNSPNLNVFYLSFWKDNALVDSVWGQLQYLTTEPKA